MAGRGLPAMNGPAGRNALALSWSITVLVPWSVIGGFPGGGAQCDPEVTVYGAA